MARPAGRDREWLWLRAGHAGLAVALAGLAALHGGEVAWGRFALAFTAIDLVGYLPGAIAFRRARGGAIAPLYHHLYNLTHSYLVAGLGVGLWGLATGGPEWAMLAVPIHLSGDRGFFGNVARPVQLPFEPGAGWRPPRRPRAGRPMASR